MNVNGRGEFNLKCNLCVNIKICSVFEEILQPTLNFLTPDFKFETLDVFRVKKLPVLVVMCTLLYLTITNDCNLYFLNSDKTVQYVSFSTKINKTVAFWIETKLNCMFSVNSAVLIKGP